MTLSIITPDWDAPSSVVAFTTTVAGGVSKRSYRSFNLGAHVGDEPEAVARNRQILQAHVGENISLCWLNQTHSDIIVDETSTTKPVEADASFTDKKNTACIVMTADCLPILLCNKQGDKVAGLHCGWQGLARHLIHKAIKQYFADDNILAWLGPAIAQQSYEVDERLYQRFVSIDDHYQKAFFANRSGHYLMSLYDIARRQLNQANVPSDQIYGGEFDTFSDPRFFSYRRNATTGRIASVIYLR